ncbi:hypothetical protein [Niveibacterium sp.]|uniref:hypothetical protein n=1 Tax=Niveibacterium sp. TaxID=2017444 RepID=UPI0035AD8178
MWKLGRLASPLAATHGSPTTSPSWLIVGGVLLVGLLAAAAIAIGLGVPVAGLFALLGLAGALAVISMNGRLSNGGVLLLLLACVALPGSYLATISPRRISFVADLWLIATSVFAVLPFLRAIQGSVIVRWLIAIFGIYIALSVASTLLGASHVKGALYQFAYNLKFPMVVFAGLALAWSADRERWLVAVMWAVVFVGLAGCAVELAAPGLYRALAAGSAEISATPNPLTRGILSRLSGPYIHSGMLALNGAFCALLFLVRYQTGSGRKLANAVGFFLSAFLLLLSGQQQETLGFILTAALIVTALRTRPSLTVAGIAFLLPVLLACGLFAALGDAQLAKLGSEWGVGPGVQAVTSARPIFFRDGFAIANDYFPFGSGLGTFGSVGAQQFDRSLYMRMGYSVFWWYRQDLFLLDTYWPNIFAESGWFGFMALFSFAGLLSAYALWRAWNEVEMRMKRLWAIAAAGQMMVFIVSLTAPQYADPSGSAWLLIWFGIAIRESTARLGGAALCTRSKCDA